MPDEGFINDIHRVNLPFNLGKQTNKPGQGPPNSIYTGRIFWPDIRYPVGIQINRPALAVYSVSGFAPNLNIQKIFITGHSLENIIWYLYYMVIENTVCTRERKY